MRRFFVPLLMILPLFLGPSVASAADPKRDAVETDQPVGGDKTDQPQAGPNADADADKADSEKPKPQKTGSRPTSMAIIPAANGLKTLTIHFRWTLIPKGSIEVRLVPGSQPKGAAVSPIYFAGQLKGTVRDALYTCLDHPGEGGRIHSFTKDKITYKMIGRRNSLGNQGVHVQVEPEDSDTSEKSPPKPPPPGARVPDHPADSPAPMATPAAAYLQLDTWAVDPETLSLDLDRDKFAKSGTLYVWFFRGDQVVWEEQIRWPGYK